MDTQAREFDTAHDRKPTHEPMPEWLIEAIKAHRAAVDAKEACIEEFLSQGYWDSEILEPLAQADNDTYGWLCLCRDAHLNGYVPASIEFAMKVEQEAAL